MRRGRFFNVAVGLAVLVGSAWAGVVRGGDFALEDGDRVIFFGDSITQNGGYVTDVEFFLLTRFPERRFTVINHGISSETISGTSEIDHEPVRPDAHTRFTRDVADWAPDHVVACFGMNDGNYHPFDDWRFQKYQKGVQRLRERVLEQTHGADLTLLTPPVFDAYRRKASDEEAREYGYKYPAMDYDETLSRYAEWLVSLREDGVRVGDVHEVFERHLAGRRRERVSFYLSGDAVHPGATGHWLMAQTLLEAWGAPGEVATVTVDAKERKVLEGDAGAIEEEEGVLRFGWRTGLPMVFDEACEWKSLAFERVSERLNRYVLRVTGLAPGEYVVSAKFARERGPGTEYRFGAEVLGQGVDLSRLARFPTVKRAAEARAILAAANAGAYKRWRESLVSLPEVGGDREKAAAVEEVRRLCQPEAMMIEIRKSDDAN